MKLHVFVKTETIDYKNYKLVYKSLYFKDFISVR